MYIRKVIFLRREVHSMKELIDMLMELILLPITILEEILGIHHDS
jgi:hypothetical protein